MASAMAMAMAMALATLAGPHARADDAERAWLEIRTADFRLLSDLPAARTRQLATDLTRFRAAAQTLVPQRQSPAPPPLKIVAFRRARDFQRVFAVRNIAGFMQAGLERHMLAFGPNSGGAVTQTAFHEYTHYLLRSRQGMNFPIWYEEGFASFLSTMRFTGENVTVGRTPQRMFRELRPPRITVRELIDERFELDWARHDLTRLYASAWTLVHMLHLGHLAGGPAYHERIPDLLARMDAGAGTARAMEEALSAGPDSLQRQVRSYARRRSLPVSQLDIPVAEAGTFQERTLETAEARHELALATVSRNSGYAMELFERLLESDPADVDALVGLSLAQESPYDAMDTVERALAVDPGHATANVRMAELTVAECRGSTAAGCLDAWNEGVRHYRLALRARPDSVGAAYGLGVVYLHTGQSGDAVNYLRVAYRRAPWAPRINFFLGEAYRLTGDKGRARTHLTKAMHWDSNEHRRERASMALALLGP